MAKKRAPEKAPKQAARQPRKKKAAEAESRGLSASEVAAGLPSKEVEEVRRAVEEQGGRALGAYRDPLGGHWQLLASLPVDKVAPTPFQRDISQPHVERLTSVLDRMDRFLDPIIAVASDQGGFWTPNGHHRLSALKRLGARSVIALVLPDKQVAYQILAMNTEKGHNLREKALEVIRMARDLATLHPGPEKDFALEFDEPALLTLGITYQRQGRFSGGAYHPVLRRVEEFLALPLSKALATREERATRLLELDEKVNQAVAGLKERGFSSPYLKNFVVARINPLRFKRGATMPFDEAMDKMLGAADRFDPAKVQLGDLAGAAGSPTEE
jgi:ParB family chromosome partitioning protein